MKQFLEIGEIVTTQALKGEVRINPWSDAPEFLLEFDQFYLEDGTQVEVERARLHKNVVVAKLKDVNSVEAAQKWVGRVLFINREDVQLDENQNFVQDLIGLNVLDVDSGEEYGVITQVTPTGANDVYYIEKDGKTRLIPAIKDVVIEVDVDGGEMRIRPLEGLFD